MLTNYFQIFGFEGGGGVSDFNTYLLRVLKNDTDWHKGGGGVQNCPKN